MPIATSAPIIKFDQTSFHAVDEVVTGLAFEIHNELGRYLDERLYQIELAARLNAAGFECVRELKIALTLEDFRKTYFADFLINGGVVVEIKTVDHLSPAHKAQVLNYLFLCELNHGTHLNFRLDRVQHQFVSTTLTTSERCQFVCNTDCWRPISAGCLAMERTLTLALQDWGTGLAPELYREVVTHFLGGESKVVREVPVISNGIQIGTQKVHCLADGVGFSITSSVHQPDSVLDHHRRFLHHTPLTTLQWVNINRQQVTFHTIDK